MCSCNVLALCTGDVVTRTTTQQQRRQADCHRLLQQGTLWSSSPTETGMERTLFGGKSVRRSASQAQTLMSRCHPLHWWHKNQTNQNKARPTTLVKWSMFDKISDYQQRPVWTKHKSKLTTKHLWHLSHSFSLILNFGLSFSQRNMTWTRLRC